MDLQKTFPDIPDVSQISGGPSLRRGDKVRWWTQLDLQKRFPIYHACPKCLAVLVCGAAFL